MAEHKYTKQELNAMTSIITSRMALATRMGVSYQGERNLFTALGYPEDILYSDYLGKFKRSDIAKAVINRPINATWRGEVSIFDSGDKSNKESSLWKQWDELYREVGLKGKLIRADKMATLGRYGVLFLGFSDAKVAATDLQMEPAGKVTLKYATPYDETSCMIHSYETEPSNERFGLPLLYQINIKRDETTSSSVLVHHSRIIHITGETYDSDVFGIPYLEAIYNRLMDIEKLVGGSAEMYWRGARPGYAGKVDEKYEIDQTTKQAIQDQIEEYEHDLRRILINEGVDLTPLAQQIADPERHVDVQISMISAVTGIPKRILTGSEIGELASSQDRSSWFDLIEGRREEYAQLQIIVPLVERLMKYKVLPEVNDFTVEWESLYTANDAEKAELGNKRMEILAKYAGNPVAEALFSDEMFLRYMLMMDDAQIEEILSNKEKDLENFQDIPEKGTEDEIGQPKKDELGVNVSDHWKGQQRDSKGRWTDGTNTSDFIPHKNPTYQKEIMENLIGKSLGSGGHKASHYYNDGDVMVRVSNHLPEPTNIRQFNPDAEKLYLIFTETELTERQIDAFVNTSLSSYTVEWELINEDNTFDASFVHRRINLMKD